MFRYLLLALMLLPLMAQAQGRDALQQYYQSVRSLSGEFVQTTRNELDEVVERSTGRMWIQRPDRFRWAYTEPFEQLIVADGEQLWVYDADLEQVTVRPLDEVLGLGPALLLSGDYAALEESFVIEAEAEGWIRLVPRSEDWDFQAIRLRMEEGVPRLIEVDSGLGQVTRLELGSLTRNPRIDAAQFRFEPPPGVDVIAPGGLARGEQ